MKNMIEEHEEFAKITLMAIIALGVVSLAAIYLTWKKSKAAREISIIVLILSLICWLPGWPNKAYGSRQYCIACSEYTRGTSMKHNTILTTAALCFSLSFLAAYGGNIAGTEAWILNMTTNTDAMLESDPEAQKLLEQ